MKYRKLGNSTLEVSEIGFGCMSLGQDQTDNTTLINNAIECGINLFDTADLYQNGENETQLGKALEGHREKVLIASKVGNRWKSDGSGWEWKPEKAYILKAVEESLRRLNTDYLDLYQLHGGTLEDPFEEIVEAFEILKQQGKILNYGISSIRPNVIRKYTAESGISSVMTQYSLLDRRPEEETLSFLKSANIGVLARGSLAQGLLVNKVPKDYLGIPSVNIKSLMDFIRKISSDFKDPVSVPLHYVLTNPVVSSVVAGIRNVAQLDQIITAYNCNFLTKEIFGQLRNTIPQGYYEQHR